MPLRVINNQLISRNYAYESFCYYLAGKLTARLLTGYSVHRAVRRVIINFRICMETKRKLLKLKLSFFIFGFLKLILSRNERVLKYKFRKVNQDFLKINP